MQNKKQLANTHEQRCHGKKHDNFKLCFDMIEEVDLMEKQHQ
jgi:hypothetical protein